MTVRDLIKRSLLLIGVIAENETPTAAQQSTALESLNDMLDSWSTENLVINAQTSETFSLVSGKSIYTIGTGGDFATSRPLEILSANTKDGSMETFMDVLNETQFADLQLKDMPSDIPTRLCYRATAPLGQVLLWPVPSASRQLVLNTFKPLTRFASVNASVEFPPGYARAVRYNLAIELCPEYGKAAPAEVVQIAMDSKDKIKARNIQPVYMVSDAPLGARSFNVITGDE